MSVKHEVPLPKISRVSSFLDSREMVSNPVHVFEKYRLEHGANFMFYFGGAHRTLVTSDPVVIQHVLKDNPANYNKSDIQVKRMAEFQGAGLLNSHGDHWLRQRRLLSKGFSHSHLAKLFPLQQEVLGEFMRAFAAKTKNGPVDINQEMVKFTLRFVGKSLFGKMMKDEAIEKLGDTITDIQAFMLKQIIQPFLIPWFKITGQSEKFQHMRREADQLVMEYVNKRRAESTEEQDMLNIILKTPYPDTEEFMNDDQVMIEILQLLVAGNETSSNVLSWTFYLLAKNPEYISRIRAEIAQAYNGDELNYEGLRKLSLTVSVLHEAMRMYPPFWMIDRVALNDDEIAGIKIAKDTMISVYIYGVHHNEQIWSEPFRFNPDRFSRINSEGRHDFAYVPFGGGPRICIGQNMAMMQILLVLISVIRKYDFKPAGDAPVDIHPMMILRPAGPIMLQFEPVA